MNEQDVMMMGYGFIPRLVMKDLNLTIEAKAIYAYIAANTGSGNTTYLPVDLICQDLKIGRDRFTKHKRMLLEEGYISSEQGVEKGRYYNNRYTLNACPAKQTEDQ